jgi:NodT family efflux transporter outer membrane factor (OMF) lipoprotein
VDWRQQAGLASGLDMEQARGATEQTRAQIPSLLGAAGQAEHNLAVLVSRSPIALHERMSAFTAPPASPAASADPLVLAIPAETLRQRPDVRAAEARVAAAWARVAQADAARYPSFSLGGSLGLGAATLGSLARGSSVLASVLASVAGPIFDGGAGRARVRAQQAAFDQAGSVYAATVFTAMKEVEDSLLALRNDGDRLRSLGLAADAARNAARLADQRYRSGLIDFQVVLETQRSQLATQDGLASTAAELGAERVRLYKALGGGWEGEPAPAAGLAAETAATVAAQTTTP